jgi:hypothetical protein
MTILFTVYLEFAVGFLYKTIPSVMKKWIIIRWMDSWGDQISSNLLWISASEIWLNKSDGLWWEWSYKLGTCKSGL